MGKEKEIDPNEIDANFVIASFKNRDRLNHPSSDPRALLPEHEKKQKQEAETGEPEKEIPHEEKPKQNKPSEDYQSLFIQEVGITARTGKSVYIRKDHHDKIMKIVQVIGKNQVSLFSYIDNVLSQHLATYQEEITKLYNKNNKGIF